jgi:hypothetical protein
VIVLLSLFSLVFMGICSLMFLVWVIREHGDAKKYRYLVALEKRMPRASNTGGPQWSITYKEGRKQQSIVIPGKTEAEAISTFVKTCGKNYDSIVSSVKL